MRDDFENRLARQKILNKHDSELFRWESQHIKKVNRFNKMLKLVNPLEKFKNRSNRVDLNKYLSKSSIPRNKTNAAKYIESLSLNTNRLKFQSFGIRKTSQTVIFAQSSDKELNISPTSSLFTANSVSGEIQNINIAFNHFKERMTEIGNQCIGEKREYFFKQLNEVGIDRFKALSTEKNRITIYNIREAEAMLQSEFEGFH